MRILCLINPHHAGAVHQQVPVPADQDFMRMGLTGKPVYELLVLLWLGGPGPGEVSSVDENISIREDPESPVNTVGV